jgi:hypothetical protein
VNRDPNPERHATLVRYLLDELTDEERDRLEEWLLVDKSAQEDLAIAEEELADRFINGELPSPQRSLLERKFSGCPEWREKTRFARLIDRAIEQRFSVPISRIILPWRKWPMVALASAAMVLAVWMFLTPGRTPTTPGISPAESAQPVPSFLLAPVVRRGDRAQSDNVVELTPGSGRIELRLLLDRDLYPAYQVRLQFLDNGQMLRMGPFPPVRQGGARPELRFPIDSAWLKPGRYTIVLQASEGDGTVTEVDGYSFRVVITK